MYRLIKKAIPLPLRAFVRPLVEPMEALVRARKLRALYRQVVRPLDLVFDVGAYQGEHSRVFLSMGARVIAFEPDLDAYLDLRDIVRENDMLKAERVAVGESTGAAQLHYSSVPAHATLFPAFQMQRFPGEAFPNSATVPVATLEDLMERYGVPDYVKIDAEGAELAILRGMRRRPRFVSFEWCKEHLPMAFACMDALKPARFNVTAGEGHRFLFKHWVRPEGLMHFLEDHGHPCGDVFARLE